MKVPFIYPAILRPEKRGAFTVTFPDFPEAITSGRNRANALKEAIECLQEAIAGRMIWDEDVPVASPLKRGQFGIPVSLSLAPKLGLYLAMREGEVTNSDLARRMGVTEMIVRRMLNPAHSTRPERLQGALEVLGKKILIAIEDAKKE